MRVCRSLSDRSQSPVALTIGNFDGVHRGHQAMLARLKESARSLGLPSCVLTFEPHPLELFSPQTAPTRLTSLREKLELLAAEGIERVHVSRFDRAFASRSPQEFIERVLLAGLGMRWLLIGDDFRFGARRTGDFTQLEEASRTHGFGLEAMPTVESEGVRVSSSVVRTALAAGRLAEAETLLGRPYSISGRVVHGDKLGRTIGYPTANVQLRHNRPPLSGIFAVRTIDGQGRVRDGAASLGLRPTVDDCGRAKLEVHLLDFAGDLYGQHLRVDFLHKIRDEQKFPDLDALKARIAEDCDIARELLAANESV
ncbi:MAG: bifunctional riboflavin kinase/FAD synthetase [Proteobacteria bacterium]|nr:bifunctional riboflavin kinase/FAD synthetase [Pseudomonadota bacterium]